MTKPKKLAHKVPNKTAPKAKPVKKTTKPKVKPKKPKAELVRIVPDTTFERPLNVKDAIHIQVPGRSDNRRRDAFVANVIAYVNLGYTAQEIVKILGPQTKMAPELMDDDHPIRVRRALIWDIAVSNGASTLMKKKDTIV